MAWVRIDDGFARHPKVAAAGPLAMAMQVAALCYCNRELTDGFVPRAVARTLLDWQVDREDGQRYTVAITSGMAGNDVSNDWVINLMVESGMWREVKGGYHVHDFDQYQPSKAEVLALSEKRTEAGRLGGRASVARRQANQASGQASGQAKVKQNSTPYPVSRIPYPVPNTEPVLVPSERAADAPPLADHPPDLPSKPRTDRQKASDVVYERKLTYFVAYCQGVGIRPESAAWNQAKDRSFRELRPLLAAGDLSPPDFEQLAHFARVAYSWRNGKATPSVAEVLQAFPEWDGAGRPNEPPPKKGSNNKAGGMSDDQRAILDDYIYGRKT